MGGGVPVIDTERLGPILHAFFVDHLITVKGLRPASVRSYRDTIRLFLHFAQGHLLAAGLARVGVASRLQPPPELAVMQEEDEVTRRRDHDRAPRQVSFRDAAVERVFVTGDEGTDLPEIARLTLVRRLVAGEVVEQGLPFLGGHPAILGCLASPRSPMADCAWPP